MRILRVFCLLLLCPLLAWGLEIRLKVTAIRTPGTVAAAGSLCRCLESGEIGYITGIFKKNGRYISSKVAALQVQKRTEQGVVLAVLKRTRINGKPYRIKEGDSVIFTSPCTSYILEEWNRVQADARPEAWRRFARMFAGSGNPLVLMARQESRRVQRKQEARVLAATLRDRLNTLEDQGFSAQDLERFHRQYGDSPAFQAVAEQYQRLLRHFPPRKPTHGQQWLEPYSGLTFVYLAPGYGTLGDPFNGGEEGESPSVTVSFSKGLWFCRTEVPTWLYARFLEQEGVGAVLAREERASRHMKVQAQSYVRFINIDNLDLFTLVLRDGVVGIRQDCRQKAVNGVSFYGAQQFAAWIARQAGLPMRLPTEAEWEYAARAGEQVNATFGSADGFEHRVNSGRSATDEPWKYIWPVDTGEPNGWHIQNLSGNVMEWVLDFYDPGFFASLPSGARDAQNTINCYQTRVLKGGSFLSQQADLRISRRFQAVSYERGNAYLDVGIRLVFPQQ